MASVTKTAPATVVGASWTGGRKTLPAAVVASDNSYASTNTTNAITLTGWGFALPSNASITGVSVGIERSASSTASLTSQVQVTTDGTTAVGTDIGATDSWPVSDTIVTYGADGVIPTPLTYSDVNASTFGVVLSVGGGVTKKIDQVTLTVFYNTLRIIPLSGTSAGTSSDGAHMTALIALSGTSVGTSIDSTSAQVSVGLSGTSAGTSRDSALFALGISGTSAGTSTDSGHLIYRAGLAGTSAGTSTDNGLLGILVHLSGTSAGTSSDAGHISQAPLGAPLKAEAWNEPCALVEESNSPVATITVWDDQ